MVIICQPTKKELILLLFSSGGGESQIKMNISSSIYLLTIKIIQTTKRSQCIFHTNKYSIIMSYDQPNTCDQRPISS